MFNNFHTDASYKKAFDRNLEADKVQLNRVLTAVTAVIYAASIPMDFWALPSVQTEVFFIRVFIVSALLLCFTTASLFQTFFLKHYTPILVTTYLAVTFAVTYTIHLAKVTELAYTVYPAVIVVSLLNFYTWTYLSAKVLNLMTVAIIGVYVLAILTRTEQGPFGVVNLLLVNLSIMGAAAVLGCMGMLVRNKNLHEKFRLQQSLEELLDQKRAEAESHEYQASHDSLTTLPNRRYLEKHLSSKVSALKGSDKVMVVLFLDLNGFKKINDDLGHTAGDVVLKVTAKRLSHCIAVGDSLVRLGGDEFIICAIIDDDTQQQRVITNIVSRVKASVKEEIAIDDTTASISTSIGVSKSNTDGFDLHELIELADKRMYDDKSHTLSIKVSNS